MNPTASATDAAMTRPAAASCAPRRFDQIERRRLLGVAGIGERVVEQLEASGFHSLQQMRALGAAEVAAAVIERVGSAAWGNRRRALARALAAD